MTLSDSLPLLYAEHVSIVFTDGECDLGALEDISFEVHPGELICFVGPSGCGKSTLLRVLAGLLEPTSGRVTLRGGSCVRAVRGHWHRLPAGEPDALAHGPQ